MRSAGANAVISIDLEGTLEIRGPDGGMIKFDLDPFRRQVLLKWLGRYRAHACAPAKSKSTFSKKPRRPRRPGCKPAHQEKSDERIQAASAAG